MSEVLNRVVEYSGKNPYACYQCGMCSAVCPMVKYMDTPPHKVIRHLQAGNTSAVLSSNTAWICVGCMKCVDRCPRNVAPGVIFEAIRLLTLRQGVDAIKYDEIPEIEEAPTLVLVAASRKLTG